MIQNIPIIFILQIISRFAIRDNTWILHLFHLICEESQTECNANKISVAGCAIWLYYLFLSRCSLTVSTVFPGLKLETFKFQQSVRQICIWFGTFRHRMCFSQQSHELHGSSHYPEVLEHNTQHGFDPVVFRHSEMSNYERQGILNLFPVDKLQLATLKF